MNRAQTHYQDEDRQRLSPAKQTVKDVMLGQGWFDLDDLARRTGIRVGTIASKLREICDKDHAFLGLRYETKRIGRGIHHYRLLKSQPEQLPLLENVL